MLVFKSACACAWALSYAGFLISAYVLRKLPTGASAMKSSRNTCVQPGRFPTGIGCPEGDDFTVVEGGLVVSLTVVEGAVVGLIVVGLTVVGGGVVTLTVVGGGVMLGTTVNEAQDDRAV